MSGGPRGFRDVSPLWAAESQVRSFSEDPNAARWTEYQTALREVDADWYYLSGHHGVRLGSIPPDVDHGTEVGFFNQSYHHGPWERGSPITKANLYVTTSKVPAAPGALGPQDNPVFARPRPKCKGIILMGCNTLLFRRARLTLQTVFPNALIIGYLGKTPATLGAYRPIHKSCNKAFFESPPIRQPDLRALAEILNKAYPRRTLVLQFRDDLFGVNVRTGNAAQAGVTDDASEIFRRFFD